MQPPTVVVVQAFPAAMSRAEAAAYVGVSESHFVQLCKTYPDRLRPFNLSANGLLKWSRTALDLFIEWREMIGVEESRRGA